MIQLLIVDAEEDLLWALSKNLFKGRKDVKVRTASTGDDALVQLKKHRIGLLITDTRVAGEIDGFNLILRAKDLAPNGKLVVMTAFSTDDSPAFEPSLGVAHFINKPFDINELRALVTDVMEDGDQSRGVMSDLALADILALICLCDRTVLLHLNHKGRRGRIEVQSGTIKHAEFLDIKGPEAVWTMLGLSQGDIFMQSDFKATDATVEMPWQALLGQAKAWLDEHGLPEDPEDEVDIPVEGWDDEEGSLDDAPDNAATSDHDSNPLGFSAEELGEMGMNDEELPSLEPPAPDVVATLQQREDTLPRPPMLKPSSQLGQRSAPARARTSPASSMGQAASSLDEIVHTLGSEIPAFVAGDIIHVEEGSSLAGHVASDAEDFDRETSAAFYGELVRTSLRAASAFGDSDLETVQITTDAHYILARMVPGTSFAQLVTFRRDGNLGIARVVMRRLDTILSLAVPH